MELGTHLSSQYKLAIIFSCVLYNTASAQVALIFENTEIVLVIAVCLQRDKGHNRLELSDFFSMALSSKIIFQMDCSAVNEIFYNADYQKWSGLDIYTS